jgi:hypothetical protein
MLIDHAVMFCAFPPPTPPACGGRVYSPLPCFPASLFPPPTPPACGRREREQAGGVFLPLAGGGNKSRQGEEERAQAGGREREQAGGVFLPLEGGGWRAAPGEGTQRARGIRKNGMPDRATSPHSTSAILSCPLSGAAGGIMLFLVMCPQCLNPSPRKRGGGKEIKRAQLATGRLTRLVPPPMV